MRAVLGRSAIALIAGASVLGSAEPPRVKVEFRLAEGTYRRHFDDDAAVLARIEAQAASRLSSLLSRRHRFLRFTSAADDDADYRITFRLDLRSRDEATAPLREVGLHVRLRDRTGEVGSALAYGVFRTAEEWHARIGTADELVREIEAKASADGFHSSLGASLLRFIPIAAQCALWADPPGWILPYRDRDLCMGRGSRILVLSNRPTGAGIEPLELEAVARMAFDPPVPPPAPFDQLRKNLFAGADKPELLQGIDPTKVTVVGVFVTKFLDLGAACREPVSPDEAFPPP
jgi:hypothetical protein